MGPLPMFCMTILLASLVVPTTSAEKASVPGATDASGAVPKPVSVTSCTKPQLPESSLTVSSPFAGPVTNGAKVTAAAQLDPATRTLGQPVGSTENPPLADMLPRFSGLPPKLAMVTDWDALVPMFSVKVSVAGEKLMADG